MSVEDLETLAVWTYRELLKGDYPVHVAVSSCDGVLSSITDDLLSDCEVLAGDLDALTRALPDEISTAGAETLSDYVLCGMDLGVIHAGMRYRLLASSDMHSGTALYNTVAAPLRTRHMVRLDLLHLDERSLAYDAHVRRLESKLTQGRKDSAVGTLDRWASWIDAAQLRGSYSGISRLHKTISAARNASAHASEDGAEVERLLTELQGLVGLDSVKAEVKGLISLMRVRRLRERHGLPNPEMSLHMVFTGSPGTGKTTVARIVGRVYQAVGLLRSGHVVEAARQDLVAEWVGQTAPKANALIDRALDGVLFIDEAYALAPGTTNDFGPEAIEVLLKRMEDERECLVSQY